MALVMLQQPTTPPHFRLMVTNGPMSCGRFSRPQSFLLPAVRRRARLVLKRQPAALGYCGFGAPPGGDPHPTYIHGRHLWPDDVGRSLCKVVRSQLIIRLAGPGSIHFFRGLRGAGLID